MDANPVDDALPTESDAASLGDRLEAYAAGLSARERQVLNLMLFRAQDPLERFRLQHPKGILTPEDEAVLRAIDAE